jgi:hypothetical protein
MKVIKQLKCPWSTGLWHAFAGVLGYDDEFKPIREELLKQGMTEHDIYHIHFKNWIDEEFPKRTAKIEAETGLPNGYYWSDTP